MKPQGSNARVGLQYGVQAETPPGTQLRLAFDTGFRLQAYADDGIAGTGPVLRGQLEWQQALGERTRLSQTTRVETGQRGTFLRNSLQVKLALQPGLVLSSGVEVRRDSDVAGRNQKRFSQSHLPHCGDVRREDGNAHRERRHERQPSTFRT